MKNKILLSATTILMLSAWLVALGLGATSDTHTVNLTVGNTNPTVDSITQVTGDPINPVESSTKAVEWTVVVTDADGVANLQGVSIKGTKTGETTRSNSTCIKLANIDTDSANYSCIVSFQYYDVAGNWTINATVTDINDAKGDMLSYMTYGTLKAWTMTPTAINFGSITPLQTNKKATDDPITMTNTGNTNISTIQEKALNLSGVSLAGTFGASNFTTGVVDDCAVSGQTLSNNAYVNVTSAVLNRYGFSWSATEELYYCIPTVPNVVQDIYDTQLYGEWTINSL